MICVNCGTENDDGVAFCSNCGKSPNAVALKVVNQQNSYPLSNLTANLFRVLFEIILWIILIGGFVGGGILFYNINSDWKFWGIVLGGIISFVIIILTGGLVSLFIKLVNNTEEIKKKIG
jgi:hypothetical protein